MKKYILLLFFCQLSILLVAQTATWSTFIDTVTTFSSPRAVHLNADTVADFVIGAGLDGSAHANGVVAIDGSNGAILWTFATQEEIFTSAQFQDINGDGIEDVFIGGRYAEFYAIDGASGQMLWEFFSPAPTEAVDSGWFNFYTPQWIPDQNGDNYAELLITNGGNHALPSWNTNRDPGYLMVLDASTGAVLAKDTMPDGEETYCSPVVADISNSNQLEIIFGSGGEDDGGALWRVRLTDLMNNDIQSATALAAHPTRGFIAPASLADMNDDGVLDIVSQAYDGKLRLFDGQSNQIIWTAALAGTESSAAPVIGNFTGDKTPDVFIVVAKGHAPAFSDFFQLMIDGKDGSIAWKDSIAQLHFASANAIDLTADGRDEVLVSLNFHNGTNFSHQLMSLDFQNNVVTNFNSPEAGVNIASTPLIEDLDADGLIEVVYAYRADSLNPMGQNGFKISKLETNYSIPAVGVAWGGYMGSTQDGFYQYLGTACGTLASGLAFNNISCNGAADAAATAAPSGGLAPYTFLWSTGDVADTIQQMDVGSYTLRVTDAAGCYVDQAYAASDPYVISFGGLIPPTCPGDSNATIQVASSGCPCMFSTCTYDWSNNGSTTKVAANLWAGWQYVTITHMDGCIVVDSTLIPSALPIFSGFKVIDLPCADLSAGLGSIEVFMSNPSTTNLLWSTGSVSNVINNLMPGNYSVQANTNSGCKDSSFFVIVAPDSLSLNTSLINLTCFGDSSGQIQSTVSGGTAPYAYLWSTGNSSQFIADLDTGMYALTVLDSLGCLVREDSMMMAQPAPFQLQESVIHPLCHSLMTGQIQLSVSGQQGSINYSWSNGSTTQDLTALGAGIYIVAAIDSVGCSAQLDTILINQPPPFVLTATTDSLNCYNDSTGQIIIASVGQQGNVNFVWSNQATGPQLVGLAEGYYQVQATDSNACVSLLDSIYVGQPNPIGITLNATNAVVACDGTVLSSVTGGTPSYQFDWSTAATTDSINNLCPGTYYLTVTDNNGCSALDSVIVSLLSSLPTFSNLDLSAILMPNPTSSTLNVQTTDFEGTISLYVLNALGQKVAERTKVSYQESFDLKVGHLAAGTYTLILIPSSQGKAVSKPFVKY